MMNIFKKADILIPEKVDFSKWSVVACDQYTSEPEYWEDVKNIAQNSPSTLNIVFPEVYLSEGEGRIKQINETMQKYIDDGIFKELKNSLVYVERTIGNGKIRHGIVGMIDLEEYDFAKGSGSYVRATEGTVLERIPPRVKIRENAKLELPHVMILIDDRTCSIVEGLSSKKDSFEKIYDFDLMKNGGHIVGYKISDNEADAVISSMDVLEKEYSEKYSDNSDSKLIFAVGDGNHSLATAKTCWENLKKTLPKEEQKNHPARFALCEIVNLHDDSLEFEPIHRVLFNVDEEKLYKGLEAYYDVSYADNGGQKFVAVSERGEREIYVKNPSSNLAVGTLQNFLDDYIKKNGGEVDYIHGDDVTRRLGTQKGNMGFLLPVMEKNELFITVIKDGALPRKTFSMGEAHEKRFYLEAKKIVK